MIWKSFHKLQQALATSQQDIKQWLNDDIKTTTARLHADAKREAVRSRI